MKYFALNNGIKMPMLGMGVSKIEPASDVARVVADAISVGFRAFDTAEFYENEDMVGRGVRESGIDRSEVFITTKVHNEAQKTTSGTLKAFEQSLDKLQMDYVDLYLMHWPYPGYFVQTYKAMEEIYKSGRAKAIGICNFKQSHFEELLPHIEIMPAVNQFEHHPYLSQKEIVAYFQQKDILVTAYCPLGRGRLGLLGDPAINEIAKKYSKTAAQVILRWNMDLGVSAITKTITPSRMAENFDIFDFKLEADDIEKINSLDTGKVRVIRDPDDPSSY